MKIIRIIFLISFFLVPPVGGTVVSISSLKNCDTHLDTLTRLNKAALPDVEPYTFQANDSDYTRDNYYPLTMDYMSFVSGLIEKPDGSAGSYFINPKSASWAYWSGAQNFLRQGWKLHVSARPSHLKDIAQLVTSVLRQHGVPHKLVSNMIFYRHFSASQTGKSIAIYPQNAKQIIEITRKLKSVLSLFDPSCFKDVEGELKLADGLYARYGAFVGDGLVTPFKEIVKDVRGTIKPPWAPDFPQE